jgi:hypothetical protein
MAVGPTFDSSIAGPLANSYCSVLYADDYFSNHYDFVKSTNWSNFGFVQKQRVLIQATRILETARFTSVVTYLDYGLYYDRNSGLVLQFSLDRDPVKFAFGQHLQFPRNLDIDINGVKFIPEEIMFAECEQAIFLTTLDETALANRIQGVTSDTVSVGKGNIHLNQQYALGGSAFAPLALEFVRPYILKTGGRVRRS